MAARLSARAQGAIRDFGRHEVVRSVLVPFALQRALLVGLVFFATRLLPSRPGVQPIPRIPLVESWVRWDSIHYLIAAEHGYGPNPWVEVDAFFPAYPWLIRGVSLIMPAPLAAFVVANLCAFGAMWALYLLVRKVEDSVCAQRSVWLALLFPSSFFLTAAYAESTYLLAATACVLCWFHREHAWAATFAAAATLARPIGLVCLTVPFVVAWLLRGAK
ncbi:MAG: hypothetical protein JRI68_07060, partial [Deltaproteobacteria bacterium]|nr:hypothetical protein [Deltaproteobacteria bacterium]